MTDIENKVRAIIIDRLTIDPKGCKLESDLRNDLGADSLEIVELMVEFEQKFDISIPDEEADKIKTVEDAITCIEKYV